MNWNICVEEGAATEEGLADLRTWNGDGIIANLDIPMVADSVARSHLPAVGFGCGYVPSAVSPKIPYVSTNNDGVSKIVAKHLIARHVRNFAYCGYSPNAINSWSREREKAYVEFLASLGYACHVHNVKSTTEDSWRSAHDCLEGWLKSLPKPIGIMAACDKLGRQILEACRSANVRVPEDVHVVGVDNDELICNLNTPNLSSVEPGARHLGYKAAELLDSMMDGVSPPISTRIFVDPVEVITRRSTNTLSVEDPTVASAMTFIASHYAKKVTVRDVIKHVDLSRSSLEKRFEISLGCSVRTAIIRFQMENARQLLSETKMPLKEIAWKLGFSSVQHMTTLFRTSFGLPPGQYRHLNPNSATFHSFSVASQVPSMRNLESVQLR